MLTPFLYLCYTFFTSSGMHGCASDCDVVPDLEEPEQETGVDNYVHR